MEQNSAETIKVEDKFERFKELAVIEGINYRQVICDVFECYIQGLKEEIKNLNEKICPVTLENTFMEIEEAEKTRDEIYKSIKAIPDPES